MVTVTLFLVLQGTNIVERTFDIITAGTAKSLLVDQFLSEMVFATRPNLSSFSEQIDLT